MEDNIRIDKEGNWILTIKEQVTKYMPGIKEIKKK